MRYVVWLLLALLIVLHQDYWQWDNSDLLWGFMPYALLYHAAISIAAALVWLLATNFCWPGDIEEAAAREEVVE